MGTAIAEVVPVALGLVLVNPLPVMAVILLLFALGSRAPAVAFVVGWLGGMGVVMGLLLFVLAPENLLGSEREPTTLSFVVRLLLGLLLLSLAIQRWRGRPGPGEEKALPGWMASLEQAQPPKALGLGALLSGANPKNLAFTITAVVAIAQAELRPGQQALVAAIFIVLGSVGVIGPVLWSTVDGERASRKLGVWRSWLTANYATMMSVVFLLFGATLSVQGLAGLFG